MFFLPSLPFSETNLCLILETSDPCSVFIQSQIFAPFMQGFIRIHYQPVIYLSLCVYFPPRTGNRISTWTVSADECKSSFLQKEENPLWTSSGDKRKVKTYHNFGCLSVDFSLISWSSSFPNVTQITMSRGEIENINGNEVKESSSKRIWKVLFHNWLNGPWRLCIGKEKKAITIIKNPTWYSYIFCVHIQLCFHYATAFFLINNKCKAFKPKCVTLSFQTKTSSLLLVGSICFSSREDSICKHLFSRAPLGIGH